MAIGVAEVYRQGFTPGASAYAGTTHIGLVPGAVAEWNARVLDGLKGPIEMGAV